MNTNVNEGFQAELEEIENNDLVKTLKAPQTPQEEEHAVKDISSSALFDKTSLSGEIPTLTQEFIIQKSKEDKLVEMGNIAQEVYETNKVSRAQVVAIESIARELIPASEEELSSTERKVVVSDHEVNMFTVEPSSTEAKMVIGSCQENIDRIVSDLFNSTVALGKKLIDTASKDRTERNERIYKGVTLFNDSIHKFLTETDSASLEGSNIKFKRELAWGNLMAIPLWSINRSDPEADRKLETVIKSFDGTTAETFVKELLDLIGSGMMVYPVLANLVTGKPEIIRDNEQVRKLEDTVSYNFTIGDLFFALTSENFTSYYKYLNDEIEVQITAAKAAVEISQKDKDLKNVMFMSDNLQKQQQCIMNISSNMAVLGAVQYLVIKFLSTF